LEYEGNRGFPGVHRSESLGLAPGFGGYDPEQTQKVFEEVERRLGEVAGVTGMTAPTVPLLTGSTNGDSVRAEGFARGPDTDADTRQDAVGDGFFDIMRIPLLYGLDATDPAIYGAAAAVLGLVAVVTGWLPAWRASRLDPMEALRVE